MEREFESGAKRGDNSNKPLTINIMGYTRLRVGYRLRQGANDYGKGNFLKGIPKEDYEESLDRHLAQYLSGDRSEDHLSAIIFNAQGLMLEEEKEGISADHYFNEKSRMQSTEDILDKASKKLQTKFQNKIYLDGEIKKATKKIVLSKFKRRK